ncbi:MAG: CheW protein [Desulfomicrobiaceae bacterium]|jgi:purine-binding chemotaxis protein CheW|nr:chemotaxis protein CheW [Desulfomicrobiaceae bacterium]MBZ4685020.1 CheW protein [Desulfomicrobiaceae bacterium]MDI3493814.1 purine-binding chemotaxis protein CheW [Desulfomicrobiaceae bacterium]HCF05101.1 chemotaxis protein CheW [Desulfomicrobiaceae bacterium]
MKTQQSGPLQMSCFYVGSALCGIDIRVIQEMNKQMEMTRVPGAPSYVLGIMNLRGRIVTIIDLGKKLGLGESKKTEQSRIIIVNSREENIGLLVDRIADVVTTRWEDVDPTPSNIKGIKGKYFHGVCKAGKELVAILDIDAVLGDE